MGSQKLIMAFFLFLAPAFAHAFDIVSGKSDLDVFQDLKRSARSRYSAHLSPDCPWTGNGSDRPGARPRRTGSVADKAVSPAEASVEHLPKAGGRLPPADPPPAGPCRPDATRGMRWKQAASSLRHRIHREQLGVGSCVRRPTQEASLPRAKRELRPVPTLADPDHAEEPDLRRCTLAEQVRPCTQPVSSRLWVELIN